LRAFFLPQPHHDQLQEGRLDAAFVVARTTAPPGAPGRDLPDADLAQQLADQLLVDADLWHARSLHRVPYRQRLADRVARRLGIQMVEPQAVAQQIVDALLEAVQP
jgi:hypothetical protein